MDSWREEQLLRRDTEAKLDEKNNELFRKDSGNIKSESAFDREPWDQEV